MCRAAAVVAIVMLGAAGPRTQQAPAGARGLDPRVVDPLLESQWHLKDRASEVGAANVRNQWPTTKGSGIVIAVVDDGLQHSHPDLQANYSSAASHDFNGNDSDPSPDLGTPGVQDSSGEDRHGTAVAGVAAAVDDNGLGGAGVSPRATLAGLRLIAAGVTDATEADALNYLPNTIHISSNSWGPSDDGATLQGPGTLTYAAMGSAVTSGRSGKGRIFVWAAGNGRGNGDNCNFDGYANSRYVIAVGAVTDAAQQASYSESCAALMVAAPSNGGIDALITTDLTGADGYNNGSDYTTGFGGTSGAAPVVSGAVALMLARNSNLTWRDVQHILRRSSFRVNPSDSGWTSGIYPHNEKYGFGQLDASAAANLAATWPSVASEVSLTPSTRTVNLSIPDDNATGVTDTISIASTESDFVVEHVEVDFTATHTWRGDLEVTLTSPSSVVSTLAPARSLDSGDDFSGWRFGSVRHWGETPAGVWTLRVADRDAGVVGTFNSWTLRIYGYRRAAFTDDPLAAGSSVIKAVHIAELRDRINAVRAATGLSSFSFTDSALTAGSTSMRAVHITELRTALAAAYTAAGQATPTYTDPSLAAGTPIKAVHITELRAAVRALE